MRKQSDPSRFRGIARHLLDVAGPTERHSATQQTFRTLREHLAARFGTYGYEVILKRAIRLTESSFPSACTIGAHADGTLQGIDELVQELSSDAVQQEVVDVLANALCLVATFVGDDLMLRLVQSKWPNVVPRIEDGAREDFWQ